MDVSDTAIKPEGEAELDGEVRSSKDYFLQVLLDVSLGRSDDYTEGRIGITVNLKGLIVSGTAVSRRVWSERLTNLIRGAGEADPTNADAAAETLNSVFTAAFDDADADNRAREEAGLFAQPRGFLHLIDVRVSNPEGPCNFPIWRAPMDDISGWTLGTHNPADS
ncbi:hypothetical protein [Cryobacterium cheniae]|nr:hypothetical protein [Cryobacterium cheniae]